jgi:hypothetical protein
VENAELSTPVGDDEPPELVAADAPPTLASAVHFLRAALLIDLSARYRGAAAAPAAPTYASLGRLGGQGVGVHL